MKNLSPSADQILTYVTGSRCKTTSGHMLKCPEQYLDSIVKCKKHNSDLFNKLSKMKNKAKKFYSNVNS